MWMFNGFLLYWSRNYLIIYEKKNEIFFIVSLIKHVSEWATKETFKNINTREAEEKAQLATFHKGWNEMQIMSQIGKVL